MNFPSGCRALGPATLSFLPTIESMEPGFEAVAEKARGERRAYRLEPKPLSQEVGQALVFRAIHKGSGNEVAFKKVRSRTATSLARMKREVTVGRALAGNLFVMPILDADPSFSWFVMPLAEGNAQDSAVDLRRSKERLRALVEAVSSALDSAHRLDWIHRDVKPANILRIESGHNETWVLADWGLGRRPRGGTTEPGRTKVGVSYGTEGFAAPELSVDAHAATPAADIYSLGQVIGWALTGNWPQGNVPLLPKGGPWRQVVKEATRYDAARRPQSIESFLHLVATELDEPPVPPGSEGEELLAVANQGDPASARRLLALAARHPDDDELFLDVLPQLTVDQLRQAVRADLPTAKEIADALRQHLESDWGDRDFDWANAVVRLGLNLAREGDQNSDLDLLESGADAVFAWDDKWDRWRVQREIQTWMESLRGEAARVVAAAIRSYPDAKRHFEELADKRGVDDRLRRTLKM